MIEEPEKELKQGPPRIVVIGVGNLLLKDEGIGIHAVKALQEIGLPRDVKIIDGGTAPDLIAYTEAGDKLIIIDAARAGGDPGTIYRFHPHDLTYRSMTLVSAHELGVEQSLKLMALMGTQPREIIIIGVEPEEIGWGLELSPDLQPVIPKLVELVLREINMEEAKRQH